LGMTVEAGSSSSAPSGMEAKEEIHRCLDFRVPKSRFLEEIHFAGP